MMASRIGLWVAAFLFTFGQAFAQEGVKPGKEHEVLKEMEGKWTISFDDTMSGKAKYEMVHGGLWLESKVEMEMPTGKFTGQGFDTYDPNKKKYISIWIDSMSTTPVVFEGDLDPATKTLTMTGKGPDMEGKIVDYKSVTHFENKDTHHFKLWMGDLKGEPMMKATYKRAK